MSVLAAERQTDRQNDQAKGLHWLAGWLASAVSCNLQVATMNQAALVRRAARDGACVSGDGLPSRRRRRRDSCTVTAAAATTATSAYGALVASVNKLNGTHTCTHQALAHRLARARVQVRYNVQLAACSRSSKAHCQQSGATHSTNNILSCLPRQTPKTLADNITGAHVQ